MSRRKFATKFVSMLLAFTLVLSFANISMVATATVPEVETVYFEEQLEIVEPFSTLVNVSGPLNNGSAMMGGFNVATARYVQVRLAVSHFYQGIGSGTTNLVINNVVIRRMPTGSSATFPIRVPAGHNSWRLQNESGAPIHFLLQIG